MIQILKFILLYSLAFNLSLNLSNLYNNSYIQNKIFQKKIMENIKMKYFILFLVVSQGNRNFIFYFKFYSLCFQAQFLLPINLFHKIYYIKLFSFVNNATFSKVFKLS